MAVTRGIGFEIFIQWSFDTEFFTEFLFSLATEPYLLSVL